MLIASVHESKYLKIQKITNFMNHHRIHQINEIALVNVF